MKKNTKNKHMIKSKPKLNFLTNRKTITKEKKTQKWGPCLEIKCDLIFFLP